MDRNQRSSSISAMRPFLWLPPEADGNSFSSSDRSQLTFSYRETTAGSGEISLFIQGHDPISGNIGLFIQGKPSGDFTLFIEGKDNTSNETTLFVAGQPSGDIPLFIVGKPSGETSLFVAGMPSGNIPLFIEGKDTNSLNLDLFISGKPSGNIPLFIEGKDNLSGVTNLFIAGKPFGSTDLFIAGIGNISGVVSLLISGRPSGDMDLFIRGADSTSGDITLFMVGCAPPVAPVVRPNLFTIPSTVIDIFEREVDALIRDLGKKIKLIYKPTIIDCPNCAFDPIGRKSANRFQSGGPQPFSDGARCPYCRGTGKTEQENSEIILGLVDWKPRDYQDFGISIQNANTIVGIKTLATDAIKIQRATEAIVDYAISDIIKLKCRKLRDPMTTGLKNSRYAISFWQRI